MHDLHTVYGLTFSYIGAFLAFASYQEASGNAEVLVLYNMYWEKGPARVPSTASDRIGRLIAYILSVLASTVSGSAIIGPLEKDLFADGYHTINKHCSTLSVVVFLACMSAMLAIMSGKWKAKQPTGWSSWVVERVASIIGERRRAGGKHS
jgi:hypothetical protein